MLLPMMAEAIQAMVLQLRGHRHRGESDGENGIMTIDTILQKLGQAFARERRAGVLEKSAAYVGVQTDDLEQVTIPITGDG